MKAIFHCSPSQNKLQFNFYLSHKSNNVTEIRRNFTNSIPIDDTMFVSIGNSVHIFSPMYFDYNIMYYYNTLMLSILF